MGTFNRHGFNTVHNSQLPKRERRGWQRRVGIAACCVIFALIVILLIALAIANLVGGDSTKPQDDDPVADLGEVKYEELAIAADQVAQGALILVDDDHPYTFQGTSHLGDIDDAFTSENKQCYTLYASNKLDTTAAEAMARMLTDQYKVTGYTIMIRYAYLDKDSKYYSEQMDTGLVANLRVMDPIEGDNDPWVEFPDIDEWFKNNAHKYGYILLDKGENDYVRYVGVAHATYMHEKNLTLAAYLEELRGHGSDKPLEIKGADNHSYLVYYTAAADTTTISVPSNRLYTVSGDNMGGVIVTVDLSAAPESTDTEANTTTTTSTGSILQP